MFVVCKCQSYFVVNHAVFVLYAKYPNYNKNVSSSALYICTVLTTSTLMASVVNFFEAFMCTKLMFVLYRFKRILVLISHSQDFLNGVCTNIIHLHQRKLKYYTVRATIQPAQLDWSFLDI